MLPLIDTLSRMCLKFFTVNDYHVCQACTMITLLWCNFYTKLVGNEAKGANLKTGISRKQSTPNFPKNEHFVTPDTHAYVCVSGGKK